MPTPQKPHQKALPGTDRGHRFVALPVHRIAPDHLLILFVSGPVNITHVMIRDKDPAIFGSPRGPLTLLQPAFSQHGHHWATAPNISARIEGITEKIADQALRGDPETTGTFDARSTVPETSRIPVESHRKLFDRDEGQPYPSRPGHNRPE